jgi:hypothetical protein
MPSFCRHNRLIQNCPICAREQDVQMRPVVTPGGQSAAAERSGRSSAARSPASSAPTRSGSRSRAGSGSRGSAGLTVRRLVREADDGYRSGLVPGLRSEAAAERLATELAFAAARLARLASEPPGLYAEVAEPAGDLEERTWLAFEIAYLGPLDGEAPFDAIAQARTPWSSGRLPDLDDVATGPRTAYVPGREARTIEAYRAWAQRAGSQAAAFTGETAWTPERRFARVFERLALPGLDRGPRFDLLVTLGRLGVYELRAGALGFGGSDPVTLAAKRILGIGDPLLLERRAAELAGACGLPLEALDVGFFNWERGARASLGMEPGDEPDPAALASARAALDLNAR